MSKPTPPTPFTHTGVLRCVAELSPNWPLELDPQHWTVSFDRTAQECVAVDFGVVDPAAVDRTVTTAGTTAPDAVDAALAPEALVAVTLKV